MRRIVKQPIVLQHNPIGKLPSFTAREKINIPKEIQSEYQKSRKESLIKLQQDNQQIFTKISKFLVDKKLSAVNSENPSEAGDEDLESMNVITNAYLSDRLEF